MSEQVSIERRNDAAWIRLTRPDRMNAFDGEMAQEIRSAIESAADASVIVLTDSGSAFCAGGYLDSVAKVDPKQLRSLYRSCLDLLEAVRLSPRPVIAAVNGAAAGAGNELVVACDLAIASTDATLGQTGPKVGSAPVYGGANLLSMTVGEKRAKEVAFMCRRYTAAQALEYGWINAVVPGDQLEAEVDKWVAELAQKSPRYLEITKMSSNVWWNSMRDNYLQGMGMLIQAIGSHDQQEGAKAFMERRRPEWEPLFGNTSTEATFHDSGNGALQR